jgi:hypothetical protein
MNAQQTQQQAQAALPETLAKAHPELLARAYQIKTAIEDNFPGFTLLIYCGWRSFEQQARLWRSTRKTRDIKDRIKRLRNKGYTESARILEEVGPIPGELGRHVTWAVPGNSWHGYGCAVDAAVLFEGKIDWKMTYMDAWRAYGQGCRNLGLNWAGDWDNDRREYVHCQLPVVSEGGNKNDSPFRALGSPQDVNGEMRLHSQERRIITLH